MPFTLDGVSLPPEAQYDPEELKRLQQQKQQQATQAAPQGQAKPSAQAKPQQKPQQQGPGIAKPLEGVGKWLEENIAIPVVDTIDNLQGDKKTPDQIARERQAQRGQAQEQMRAFEDATAKDPVAEVIRGVAGGVEDLFEGAVNFPGQVTTLFGNDYKPVRSNLIKDNNTVAGDGLRTLTRYVTGGLWGSKLTGGALTAGQSGAALAGGRLVQGFIEDFLGADGTAEDQTLIGSTPFTKWLQTQDTNNPIHNRALVGLEGALFEAAGVPAVKAMWNVSGASKAYKQLGDLSSSYFKGKNQKKLQDALAKVQSDFGIKLDPVTPETTEEQLQALLDKTRSMLSDPQVLRDQRKAKAVAEYERAVREAAAPRLALAAQGRLKKLLAKAFADDQFGRTLDYTRTAEADLVLRAIAEDPQRLKLNKLISEAAGTTDETDPIFSYLRQRVEAYPAAKQLDDIANTVQYGGPPDELVLDGGKLPEYTDYLSQLDGQISIYEKNLADVQKTMGIQESLIADLDKLNGASSLRIAGLEAELPNLPSRAQAEAAQSIPFSLSKAQVTRLQQIQLPEGVTITPGRRVQGLTPNNINEFKASIDELASSGDQVAVNLAARLGKVGVPEPIPADFRSQESIQEMLAQLKQERQDVFQEVVTRRQELGPMRRFAADNDAQVQNLRVQREAFMAKMTAKPEQFAADYIPVNMTSKNITSIVKERGGGQPGVDLYFEDKRFPALLDGRVKDIGRQGNQSGGYGNYIVVESIDPKTGQTVDVLYAHLADGSIKVKEGDMVGTGQQIGTQGGTGSVRSVDGTIASVDFLAPAPKGSKSMTPYARWSQLVDELSDGIRKGTISPSQVGSKAPAVAPEAAEVAARQADEIIPTKTRKEAVEAGYEVGEVVPAVPRTSLLDTFDDEESVINTAKPGKASLTEADIYSLSNDTQGFLLLEKVVGDIDREVLFTPSQTVEKMAAASELAKEWLDATDDDLLASLKNPAIGTVVDGEHLMLTTKGYAATGLVLKELQRQAKDLGYSVLNNSKDGAPEAVQDALRLVDRMGAMLRLRTMHKQVTSGKLRELGYIAENLADGPDTLKSKSKLFKELEARHLDDLAKDQQMYQTFNALKKEIRAGNPAAFKHLERVAAGMAVSVDSPKNAKVWQTVLASNGKNIDALYVNSILSGPLTQQRNFWGNFYQAVGHPVQAYLGTMLPGKANAKIRMQATAALGATYDSYKELTSLIGRLYKEQWKAMDDGIKEYSVWDEELERNMARIKAMAEADELGWAQQSTYALAVNVRKLVDSPFMRPMMAFMGATDKFFQVVAARQVAARRAVEDALVEMGDAPLTGKRSQQFGELVEQLKEYHVGKIFSDDGFTVIDEEAKHLGQTLTFQTPIGESDEFTKRLNQLSSVPLMKTLGITFVKTPSAILKASANLTPGLSTLLKHSDQLYKNGSDYYRAMRDGAEAASYIIGASAFIGGASGALTGAGPLRGENRDTWLTHNKPYTLTLGELEINYQGMEPATTVIGLFADMGSLFLGGRSEQENAWLAIVPAIMSNVVNKSYLTQISTMAQLINASSPNDIKKLGENIARGLVPYSGMRNQVGQYIDSALREVRSQIEPSWSWYLKKHTGLGSTTALPQQLDPVTGKPLSREGLGSAGGFVSALQTINPIGLGLRLSKNRFEPVHKMLAEEGVDIDNDQRKLNTQDMTNEEVVEYVRLRAGDGELKKDLLTYFNSPQYKNVDKPESERQRQEGVDVDKTYAHEHIMGIVRMHHDRAVATMELGLTDVSQGFAKRRQEALKGAFKQEKRYNRTADVLNPQEVVNNYPY
jgi:hypothetical protein